MFKQLLFLCFFTSFIVGTHEPQSALQQALTQHQHQAGSDVEAAQTSTLRTAQKQSRFCPPNARCCIENCPFTALFIVVSALIGSLCFAVVHSSHTASSSGGFE